MTEKQTEALEKLNQGIQESKYSAQQQTIKLVQGYFDDSMETLKQQIKENRATLEDLPDQIPGGREEAFQAMFQELMGNYGAIEDSLDEARENVSNLDPEQIRRQAEVDATDAARRDARELGIDITEVEGTGSDGRVTVDDVKGFAEAAEEGAAGEEEVPKASDAAVRRAEEMGIDLSQVVGTGSGGSITVKDVTGLAEEAQEQAAGGTGQVAQEAQDAAGQTVQEAQDTAGDTAQQVQDAAGQAAGQAQETAEGAAQQAQDAAGQVTDQAGQVAGQAQGAVGGATQQVQDTAGQVTDQAGQAVQGVQDTVGGLTGGQQGGGGPLGGVTDQVGQVAQGVQDTAGQAAGQATAQAGQVAGQAQQAAGQATQQAQETVGQATRQAQGAAGQVTEQAAGEDEDEEPRATNAARRKAEELGVDLSGVQGSGAGGLITIRDVTGS